MTYNPNQDRTYWRACDNKRLIEAARDSGHELAIALGERLEELAEADDQLYDLERERDELERRVNDLRAELNALYDAPGAE